MKKNKKLLIIVSCLLLVGGISFAYFIASTIFSGEGSNVGGTTAIINDSELRVEGTLEFQDLDIYPGHQNVSSIKVTATGDTKVILTKDEFITASPTGLVQYYYIVLEYPNLDENQNSDIGGSFSGEVSVEESDAEPDINIIAAYIKQEDGSYEEVSDIPQEGYVVNTELSMCSNGATPNGTVPNITINNLSKSGTSCYLYLDEYLIKNYVLSHYDTILTRTEFSQTVTNTTTGTIYKSFDESQYDNDGEVYYFAGNPTDNWVQFGGYYWRIIRINGNGSIRMIYQGDSANTTGEGMQITVDGTDTGAFNSSNNNNMYVGYMYGSGVHGLSSNSTIKGVLDQWYQDNLSSVSDKIDGKAGFCGDREPSTSESSSNGDGGTGTTTTYYGAYIRLITNKAPTFECQNESDLYTDSGSENGNKALTYPIGLISADEVAYAGGIYGTNNTNFYLYTGQVYWTMSPYNFNGSYAYEFSMNVLGGLGNTGMTNMRGIRPVINLKADVTITGSGTTTDPYKVEGV